MEEKEIAENNCGCENECECGTRDDLGLDAINTLTHQNAELKDSYLRVAAELENTRRRAGIDIESAAKNRALSIMTNFLPLIDAIESAAMHAPLDAGIESLSLALSSVMESVNITKIESIGLPLDPKFHNAIEVAEDENADANTIIGQFQSGYKFGEIVLRPAMVIVAK